MTFADGKPAPTITMNPTIGRALEAFVNAVFGRGLPR
jgi:hypothetical protein